MPVDTTSATWREITTTATEAISAAWAELERPETTVDRTSFLRGKIAMCREILTLSKPVNPVPVIARDDHAISNDAGQAY